MSLTHQLNDDEEFRASDGNKHQPRFRPSASVFGHASRTVRVNGHALADRLHQLTWIVISRYRRDNNIERGKSHTLPSIGTPTDRMSVLSQSSLHTLYSRIDCEID